MMRDRLRRGLHHRRSSIAFLLPSLTGVLLFYVLPFGVILYYSVQSRAVGGGFVGLQNYLKLFRNSAFLLAAKNTALQMLITVPLGVLLPLGLALILERSISARSSLRAAFLSPFFVPTASVVLVWQVLFHQNGTRNALLNLNVDWFHSSFSQIVTITLCLWKNIGYHTILLTSALASIPRNYLDMARLDGAGPFRCFFYIKIRFLAPSVFFVSLMSYMAAVKIFREVYAGCTESVQCKNQVLSARSALESFYEQQRATEVGNEITSLQLNRQKEEINDLKKEIAEKEALLGKQDIRASEDGVVFSLSAEAEFQTGAVLATLHGGNGSYRLQFSVPIEKALLLTVGREASEMFHSEATAFFDAFATV